MKKLVIGVTSLVIILVAFTSANAQFTIPSWGVGFEGGAARGDNPGVEKWVPAIRTSFQINFSEYFAAQAGLGYAELKATGDDSYSYESHTISGDARMLWSPVHGKNSFPYIFTGVGLTKNMKINNSPVLPMIPMGMGIESRVGSKLFLQFNMAYNLSLSDSLDNTTRPDESMHMNNITNGKNDAFFTLMFGLVYTFGKADTTYITYIPDSEQDTDGDGLNDRTEREYGTDLKNPDSDGDGLKDGEEVKKYHSNPLKTDTDSDGLSDNDEVVLHKSDPLKADTDLDGMPDGDEVTQSKTNPSKADSDDDGMSDSDELQKYSTDPKNADSDGDGVNDGDEVLKHSSDPKKTDTDGDGISDGDEVTKYKTDPTKTDSDSDGLTDFAELTTHNTNPLKGDTDDGGMNDGAEIKHKRNPLDPSDDLFEFIKGKKVILRGINFATNKSKVLPESEPVLERAHASMVANPDVTIVVTGHTDNVGGDDFNRNLSLKRAQAVKDWLVKKGIAANRMKVVGKGETDPMATNDTEEGRAENRRMEFTVE